MTDDRLRERIADQFSGRGESADIWRGLERFLDTDEYLNLGYSPWYLPAVVGSSQRRLARVVGRELAARVPEPAETAVLDVGSGRGGPALEFATRWGFDVAGVDLVPANVATSRANARDRATAVDFVVGDATRLPVADGAVDACTAVDAIVYMPEKEAVFADIARVLRDDGVVVVSDLLARDGLTGPERETVDTFADAWDLAPLASFTGYRAGVEAAGLDVETVRDISANSVGRFRRWTRLYRWLADHARRPLHRLLTRWGLDPAVVERQIRVAHRALPHLRHVLVVARH